MAKETRDLNFSAISFTLRALGFEHTIQGFAEGTAISVERNERSFSRVTGADGHTTRIHNADKSGKYTFTLLASSDSNAVLSERIGLDENTGEGYFSVQIDDPFGNTTVGSISAWIEGLPTVAYSKDGDEGREWVIEAGEVVFDLGAGNLL